MFGWALNIGKQPAKVPVGVISSSSTKSKIGNFLKDIGLQVGSVLATRFQPKINQLVAAGGQITERDRAVARADVIAPVNPMKPVLVALGVSGGILVVVFGTWALTRKKG